MKIETAIAGASFRELGTEIISGLKPGQQFELRMEPSNPHDRNAVQVIVPNYSYGRQAPKDHHVGYVPRKWSGTVTAALKNNRLHVWAKKENDHWGTFSILWEDVSEDPLA